MKLKLEEDPKEWLKFTAVMAVAAGLMAFLFYRRKVLGFEALVALSVVLGLVMAACTIRPRWFRGFYRAGMTVSFHLGQALGWVWLALFFLLVLTPLGLLLRVLGKDLLALKRRPADSYWRTPKAGGGLDRQF